jgi:hypothetical protein
MIFRGNVDRGNEFRGKLTRGNEISGYCNFGEMRINDEIVTLTSEIHHRNILKDHQTLNYFFLNNTIFSRRSHSHRIAVHTTLSGRNPPPTSFDATRCP